MVCGTKMGTWYIDLIVDHNFYLKTFGYLEYLTRYSGVLILQCDICINKSFYDEEHWSLWYVQYTHVCWLEYTFSALLFAFVHFARDTYKICPLSSQALLWSTCSSQGLSECIAWHRELLASYFRLASASRSFWTRAIWWIKIQDYRIYISMVSAMHVYRFLYSALATRGDEGLAIFVGTLGPLLITYCLPVYSIPFSCFQYPACICNNILTEVISVTSPFSAMNLAPY